MIFKRDSLNEGLGEV